MYSNPTGPLQPPVGCSPRQSRRTHPWTRGSAKAAVHCAETGRLQETSIPRSAAYFATASLEHGMDAKTLSTIIGHVSSSTTLNIYAHVTDEMQRLPQPRSTVGSSKARPPKRLTRRQETLRPPSSSPTKASAASRAPAVSARSMTTSGRPILPRHQWKAHGPECLHENGNRV